MHCSKRTVIYGTFQVNCTAIGMYTYNSLNLFIYMCCNRFNLYIVSLSSNHKLKLQSEIAEEMEIDSSEIASKLHNLRCQYNGELRKLKLKKSISGTDKSYVSRWEFFNALKFLSNAGQPCKTLSKSVSTQAFLFIFANLFLN